MEFTILLNSIASVGLFNNEAFKYYNFWSSPQQTPWHEDIPTALGIFKMKVYIGHWIWNSSTRVQN